MKNIALIITLAAGIGGCSTNVSDLPSADNSVSPVETAANANSNMVPYNSGVDPSAFNGNSNNLRAINSQRGNQDSIVGPRSAPDNSEFNTTMNGKGEVTETRTFKDHPQLLKIERKTVADKQTLKVYLKNGKVYDVSKEQVPNFTVAAPGNILKAVGIAPQPGPGARATDANAAKQEKKQDQQR